MFGVDIRYQEKSVVEFTICIDTSGMGGGIIGVLTKEDRSVSNHLDWQAMCLQDYINIKSWDDGLVVFEFSFVPGGKRWGTTALWVADDPCEDGYRFIYDRVQELRKQLRNNGGVEM